MSIEGVGVAVVGSANLDVVVSLPRFPAAGETVLGDDLVEVAGGKGLNQAIAAAAGAPCAFVACLGGDAAGGVLLTQLAQAGVDVSQVVSQPGPTGRAYIEVTPDGENRIVVMALANRRLEADVVGRALDALQPAVVLAQLEIPLAAVEAAADWAAQNGARFVLNASPVGPVPAGLLANCDPLVVNTGEAAALLDVACDPTGTAADGVPPAQDLAGRLSGRVRSAAVTDGPRGVHVATHAGDVSHVPGVPAEAVDTTGAGDMFAGTLASALARGLSLDAAATLANEAAAAIVQVPRTER